MTVKVIDFQTRAFQKRTAKRLRLYCREIAFPKERLTPEKKKEMFDFAVSIGGSFDEKIDMVSRDLAKDLLLMLEDFA